MAIIIAQFIIYFFIIMVGKWGKKSIKNMLHFILMSFDTPLEAFIQLINHAQAVVVRKLPLKKGLNTMSRSP